MRILRKKEPVYDYLLEKFDLDGIYAGQDGIPAGVLILYLLIRNRLFGFTDLSASSDGDIGEPRNIYLETEPERLSDLSALARVFLDRELSEWKLEGTVSGEPVFFSGRTYTTVVGARTPVTAQVNLLPLLSSVELATYNYHSFDPALVEGMKERFRLNQKNAVKTLSGLQRYPDIYAEFSAAMTGAGFCFPEENLVTVEGYTARMLHENFPLSELGAYNYLIYLRESPQEALSDLKKGLPRR